MISVKDKYLSEYPDIVKDIDTSIHVNLDTTKIKAGSNKIVLYWVCQYCKESYKRNINHRVRNNCMCPKKECMLLKRTKTNNEQFGWNPRPVKIEEPDTKNYNIVMSTSIEEWKDLPNKISSSKYEISNKGNLRNKQTKELLSNKARSDGYIRNTIFLDNKSTTSYLRHILVALAFIPNPNDKPTVNHINRIKTDNFIENLEWATYSEQNRKNNKSTYKQKSRKGILQYDLKGNFIKSWEKAIDIENELKISRKNILKVAKGERKHAGGYKWRYNIEQNKSLKGEIWIDSTLGTSFVEVLVSNFGRIKVKNNIHTYGTLRQRGYCEYKVYNNDEKKYKTLQIHRLVAMAFIPNPENKKIVNHKDENRSNNNIENLEWVTSKENCNYSLDLHNRLKKNCKSKIVLQINIHIKKIINEFLSVSHASKLTKINSNCIRLCCLKKQLTSGGYKWEYKMS